MQFEPELFTKQFDKKKLTNKIFFHHYDQKIIFGKKIFFGPKNFVGPFLVQKMVKKYCFDQKRGGNGGGLACCC